MAINTPRSSSGFPVPIGGVPFPGELPPSLLFEIAYILIIPLIVFRFVTKASRTMVIMGVTFTTGERIMNFAFRIAQADNSNLRTSKFMLNWLQGAYCAGFLALANDVLHIARAYLVNTTRRIDAEYAGDKSDADGLAPDPPNVDDRQDSCVDAIQLEELGASDAVSKMSSKNDLIQAVKEVKAADIRSTHDEPKRRLCFRIICITLTITFGVAAILGAISGGSYYDGMTNRSKAKLTQQTRFLEAILGLVILQSTNLLLLTAWVTRSRRVHYKRVLYLCLITCILTIPPVYRLAVMSAKTTSLLTTTPDSFNGFRAKALFYGLHIFPELIGAVLLLGINVRTAYNTGLGGDFGVRDRTSKSQ
ncbi:hypothetical protein DAEQUDRAFT_727971 [Daedalea quercina L-15889]|uniref:Uncharacterized protein n=1 Tax=Daedalea quercina L-15889 TaxID=1314783 RepID=A0A165PMK3_9APHY|nr:hypothetical protein DAEQUDRAFT_727971 [Daedalea quercina L-15889]